jgi:hypothetical protein
MEPSEGMNPDEMALPREEEQPQTHLNDGIVGMDSTGSESLMGWAAGEAANGIFDGICNVAIDGCAGCSLVLLLALFLMAGTAVAVFH